LFDPKRGFMIVVQHLVDWRDEQAAQMHLVRWAVPFAGAGLLVLVGNVFLQAAGVIK